jgi:hypothetical protein
MSTSKDPFSDKINNFNQYPGESLMEASYRMDEIREKCPINYSQTFILRRFHTRLDVWSKLFLDSLIYGRHHMKPLFFHPFYGKLIWKPRKPKEETEIQQLKKSLEEDTVSLQISMK